MQYTVFNSARLLLASVLLAAMGVSQASSEAPSFTLPDGTGSEVSLDDFAGDVVVLNFWASWCGPCRAEMPLLDQLSDRYSGLGFTMLGINVEEDSSLADRFLEGTPVEFPILYDRANSVSELYDVVAMPTTVILDRKGSVRFVHHGYEPGYENDYQEQIRALIRE